MSWKDVAERTVKCGHPGCATDFVTGDHRAKYCHEHRAAVHCNTRRAIKGNAQRRLGTRHPCKGCSAVFEITKRNQLFCTDDCGRKYRRDDLRDRRLIENYQIDLTAYLTMNEKQAGLCAICRRKNSADKMLCVDHDHVTGVVRELLCNRCNLAVGYMEALASDGFFNEAVEYLRKHGRHGK